MPYAKYFQLATVKPDGKPANRTVVYRGFRGPSRVPSRRRTSIASPSGPTRLILVTGSDTTAFAW